MKLTNYIAGLALTVLSANASAIPIGVLGGYDTLKAQADLGNSGSAVEQAWVEAELGFTIEYTQLDDITSSGSLWETVDGGIAGDYAFDFGAIGPAYFLVKTGNGGNNTAVNSHYLFENMDSLEWAFVNLSVFGVADVTNVGVISHAGVSESYLVPEPGILALLGIGLVGFSLRSNKKIS